MNPSRLITHYDEISDAPDATSRLRNYVLELAVRGKLISQDPNDESASEFLKRYEAEGVGLDKVGMDHNNKVSPTIEAEDAPFMIPSNWCWVRFGSIVDFSAGRTPPRNEPSFWNNGDHAWVSIADMKHGDTLVATKETISNKSARKFFRSPAPQAGTIIMSFKLTIGKTARLGIPAYHNEAIISIHPIIADVDPYLFIVLPYFARLGNTKAAIKGVTLNRKSISNIAISFPPLAEQHRIVAKFDELMKLCDRLESTQKVHESTRDRLVTAALGRISNPDREPVKFKKDAAFVLKNLGQLTTYSSQIKVIRETILNLAVHGRLVEQDPADEPASELLMRIEAAKTQLVKSGKNKKTKSLPPEISAPYSVPYNWSWVPIRQISSDRGQRVPDSEFTYIDVSSIDKERGVISVPTIVQASNAPSRARKVVQSGDVVFSCVRPYLLNIAVVDNNLDPPPIASTAFAILNGHGLVLPWYLWIVLRSPFMVSCVEKKMRGQAYPALNDKDFAQLPFPLPPLAEQHRIVDIVGKLLSICDLLKANLGNGEEIRCNLLGMFTYQ